MIMIGPQKMAEAPPVSLTEQGACVGDPKPDRWYAPEHVIGRGGRIHPDTAAAVAICRTCTVRGECLEYALSTPDWRDFGVWAGLTKTERDLLRRQRRTA